MDITPMLNVIEPQSDLESLQELLSPRLRLRINLVALSSIRSNLDIPGDLTLPLIEEIHTIKSTARWYISILDRKFRDLDYGTVKVLPP
ncbi:predicted protein [Plenodomus lingam JN3]|uniref:Predicted protein n=1 Tax=Leptosphaeria maculans (strain JN3 / isolate v23.1.3 / race Av1-4-5-6-7-8) TaxID=985895 RepID=E4ZP44_LEPMJ|nr:predicted protein [Plenodomus lingam JN3]CBX93573.1 predicted protein [Plenodomus lingam JN3]